MNYEGSLVNRGALPGPRWAPCCRNIFPEPFFFLFFPAFFSSRRAVASFFFFLSPTHTRTQNTNLCPTTRRHAGHMLLHAHDYLLPHGYLYLVLPLPCLTNSRYLSHARLTSLLTSTGWTVERQHDSAKLTYWLLKRSGERGEGEDRDGKEWKREVVRKGAQRNNFCVLVQPGKPVVRAGAAGGGKLAGAVTSGDDVEEEEEEGDGTAIEQMEQDDDDDDE